MDIVIFMAMLMSGAIVISVIELIRRNRLKEKYSLLWLVSSLVILLFSSSRNTLHAIALSIGILYPPSLLFLLAFLFLIVINIHFSTVISELFQKNKDLTQEVALLKRTVKEIKSVNE